MKHQRFLALVWAATASAPILADPAHHVIPRQMKEQASGLFATNLFWRPAGSRYQWIIRGDLLTEIPVGAVIRGIQFRAGQPQPGSIDLATSYPSKASSLSSLLVQMSQTPFTAINRDVTFSKNFGWDLAAVVPNNPFEIPAASYYPSTTYGEFGPVLWLGSPYTYKGQNLLIDVASGNLTGPDAYIPIDVFPRNGQYGGTWHPNISSLVASGNIAAPIIRVLWEMPPSTLNNYGQTPSGGIPSGDYRSIEYGKTWGVAVRTNGTLQLIGNPASPLSPAPTTPVAKVAVGDTFGVLINLSGGLFAWGANDSRQLIVPSGQFVEVSAGSKIGVAIRLDGSVAPWGDSRTGILRPPTGRFRKVECGDTWAVGLRSDGTLAFWGTPPLGSTVATLPTGTFIDIAAGPDYAIAVRSNGEVISWGTTRFGLNVPNMPPFPRQIDAGLNHAVLLTQDFRARGWGSNVQGQLGFPTTPLSEVDASQFGTMGRESVNTPTVQGEISFEQSSVYVGDISLIPIRVTFTPQIGNKVTVLLSVNNSGTFVNNSGTFSFTSPVPAGNYRIRFEADRFLDFETPLLSVNNSGTFLNKIMLFGGDADGDNEVNFFDYLALSDAFGTRLGDVKYDATADFDGDDEITAFDYLILSRNFGIQGSP